MKNIQYKLILALFCVALFWGCKRDYIELYDSVAYIQFGSDHELIYNSYYDYKDTLKKYSFGYDVASVTETDVYFDLYAIGGPREYDRPFKLRQIEKAGVNNAVAGEHYVAFDSEEMKREYIIPKGEIHLFVPIRIKRSATPDIYELRFELVETEDFKLGEKSQLRRCVEFTSELQRPLNWTAALEKSYFGRYTKIRHSFMIEVTGQRWDFEFIDKIIHDYTEQTYWVNFLNIAINERNAEREAQELGKLEDEYGVISFP